MLSLELKGLSFCTSYDKIEDRSESVSCSRQSTVAVVIHRNQPRDNGTGTRLLQNGNAVPS